MRVISQDGTVDVPYELCGFCTGKTPISFTISAHSKALDEKPCVLATYTNEEKSLKAIQMLRERYLGSTEFHYSSELSGLSFPIATVFQFPKDEEIEV